MTPAQSLAITRFVRAACPQQKFDEYTPDAWHELLGDLDFADCDTAVRTLGKRQPFISPAEIRDEVQRIRNDRLRRYGNAEPDYDGDDVPAALEAIKRHRARVASGEITEPVAPQIDGPRKGDVEKLVKRTAARLPKMPPALPQADLAKKRAGQPEPAS
jgi:hypothetical protein